ncbi:amidohydrolase family protein, partial [Halomonas sp. BBD48]|nr:amidohydrolase family protein [Halomonas sp. BBD48]
DATRVSSYNPWTSLYWLVSGRTVGGLELYSNGLDRDVALQLFTQGSAWFSSEQGQKGQIKVGQLADLAALSADFFSVDEEAIKWIESVLTVVGGKVVHGADEFDALAPPALPVTPDWSPVARVPGHWRHESPLLAQVHHCSGPCAIHAHNHDSVRTSSVPVSDFQGFWGAFGCSCFAF